MILSLLGWLVWFVYGQERFTERGCLSTSCKTQVNGEMSFYFEVASAYSRKQAVVQGLCRSRPRVFLEASTVLRAGVAAAVLKIVLMPGTILPIALCPKYKHRLALLKQNYNLKID